MTDNFSLPRLLNHHLLLWALGTYILGIIAAQHFPIIALPAASCILLALTAGAVLLHYRYHYRHRSWALYLIIAAFLPTGYLHAGLHLAPPRTPTQLANLIAAKTKVTLSGTLTTMAEYDGERTKLILEVDGLLRHDAPGPTNAGLQPATGLVRLSMPGTPDPRLVAGQLLLLIATIQPPAAASTPGTFDYKLYLAGQEIYLAGWVNSAAEIIVVREAHPAPLRQLRASAELIRQQVATFLATSLEPPVAGLYQALLIGSTAGVPAATLESFTATGCIHILSISGLHLSLLGLMTTMLVTWLLKRSVRLLLATHVPTVAALISIFPLLYYALIAGLNPPVLRAVLMAMLVILALTLRLEYALTQLVAGAAFLILLVRPLILFSISFQLSVTAVLAIALIYPNLPALLEPLTLQPEPGHNRGALGLKVASFLQSAFLVSCAATLGTLPLLLYHFNRFSLSSPLVNPLIEPFFCFWALPLGLLAIPFIWLYPPLAAVLLKTGGVGLLVADKIISWASTIPFSSLWTITPSPGEIICYYILLYCWLRRGKSRRTWLATVAATLLLLLYFTQGLWLQRTRDSSELSFLDVGQGSATVIQLPGGTTALLDGGGSEAARFNAGERTIAPFLWHQRLWRVDDIIITHPHADHFNGIPFILRHFHPQRLWLSTQNSDNALFGQLLATAKKMEVEIHLPTRGQVVLADPKAQLVCLDAPLSSDPRPAATRPPATTAATAAANDNGLILQLTQGHCSFLFPGDISRQMERQLLERNLVSHATVLVAAHHGSRNSCDPRFIEHVQPQFIIVSSGRSGTGRYPATEHLASWHRHGFTPLLTAEYGTISCTTTGENLRVAPTLLADKKPTGSYDIELRPTPGATAGPRREE